MMDFNTLLLPASPLREVEVWGYYDGPQCILFASEVDPDLHYVATHVEDGDDDDSMVWLAALQREAQINAVKTGKVDFRDVYTATADGLLHVITWRWVDEGWVGSTKVIPVGEALEAWLPMPEARLGR